MVFLLTAALCFGVYALLDVVDNAHAGLLAKFQRPDAPQRHQALVFSNDDGSGEIHAGAGTGMLVIANRFTTDRRVVLSAVSFYTGGAAEGDPVAVILYEDPFGMAEAPDATMEVFRTEVVLKGGGFQVVDLGAVEIVYPDASLLAQDPLNNQTPAIR